MRTKTKPLVSVIIAVRNGERFLAQAIQSILDQTYRSIEIIVIDGRSTDSTARIANSFEGIRYIYQEKGRLSDAYNLGIDLSHGEYVAFLSHDDLWTKDKLEVQARYMIDHPEIQYTVAKVKFLIAPGASPPRGLRKELLEKEHVAYIMETLVARRALFQKIGKFDPQLKIAADVDWFARARDRHIAMAVLPHVLLHKRYHDKNLSMNIDLNNQNLLNVLQRSVSRKRNEQTERALTSVIMPVHNGELYITEAIESVLSQTLSPYEVIVIDDGSTDQTAQVVKQFGDKVRYHFQPQSGPGVAKNRGVELAGGDLLAFLDADDVWLPDKLVKQVQAFNQDPDLEIVFGMVEQFYSPDLDEESKKSIYCPPESMPGVIPSAMIIKKEAFLKVGPFESKIVDFPGWYMRCKDKGLRMKVLDDLVTRRRLHRSNIGVTQKKNIQEYLIALKESLDRRRPKDPEGERNG